MNCHLFVGTRASMGSGTTYLLHNGDGSTAAPATGPFSLSPATVTDKCVSITDNSVVLTDTGCDSPSLALEPPESLSGKLCTTQS